MTVRIGNIAFDCDDVLRVAPLDLMQDPEGNEFCVTAKSFTG